MPTNTKPHSLGTIAQKMPIDKISNNWLFETHSEKQISKWVSHLKYFYFFRAHDGHANDGDCFKAAIKYVDKADLVDKLHRLGITLKTIPSDYPKLIFGKPYSHREVELFKNEIKDFPDFEQPSNSIIIEIKCFIWAEKGRITFSIQGTNSSVYSVTQADFEACKKLETLFDEVDFQNHKDKAIENSAFCISKNKYPELYD